MINKEPILYGQTRDPSYLDFGPFNFFYIWQFFAHLGLKFTFFKSYQNETPFVAFLLSYVLVKSISIFQKVRLAHPAAYDCWRWVQRARNTQFAQRLSI